MNQPVPPKHFNKLVEMNPNISYAINTLIAEYDIQRCHPTCMYFLKGKEFYDQLMKMPKFDSNVLIGKMMKEDLTLSDKIGNLKLKFFNDFCKLNNIKDSNFISSTVDSMLLVNKKPMKTKLENGIVNFRNKDGEFTSYIRLSNNRIIEILFDGMSNNIRIKGVNVEYVDKNNVFIRLFKQYLILLENSNKMQTQDILRKLNHLRSKYINSKDPMMWASLLDGNKYAYIIAGERVLSDEYMQESEQNILIKTDNYMTFISPLIKLYFKPH